MNLRILFVILALFPTLLQAQDALPVKARQNLRSELVEQLQRMEWDPGSDSQKEHEQSALTEAQEKAMTVINYAKKFIGCRYRSGGKGPQVFDCSGFTGYVFRNFGYEMGASSRDQFLQGTDVSRDEVQPGDLMFFGGRGGKGRIGHVALVVDVNPDTKVIKFIHASSNVGITINQFPDGGYYSNRYIGAKRIL